MNVYYSYGVNVYYFYDEKEWDVYVGRGMDIELEVEFRAAQLTIF